MSLLSLQNYDNTSSGFNIWMYSHNFENSREEWKVSTSCLPHHNFKPLPQEPYLSPIHKKTKPLPAIPKHIVQPQNAIIHNDFVLPTTSYYHTFPESVGNAFYEQNTTNYSFKSSNNYYCPQLSNDFYPVSPSSSNSTASDHDLDECVEEEFSTSNKGTFIPPQYTPGTDVDGVRQFTVKSVNDEHRVWITIDPKDTGESIAKKIHALATFRTQKVLTVSTSTGRKIPLNKTPIFRNWEEMDSFKNGETWSYTCGPLKKSTMDNFLSKFIQV